MTRYLLSVSLLLSLTILPSCGGPGSGFSLPGTVDDDDDDHDPTYFGTVQLRGSVRAVDRETGVELTEQEYDNRAGGMLLYVLEDPANLSESLDKFAFDSPS